MINHPIVRFLSYAAGILVPRFLTEDVAVNWDEDADLDAESVTGIAVPLDVVGPGEVFDAIVRVQIFNLFGLALFPRQVGEVRPFVNPHDLKVSA